LIAPPLGIIEGFFGPMWSWSARERVVRMLAPAGYTRYVYAPKGDAALRRGWDAPYERAWLHRLAEFAKCCSSLGVEFGVGISPYGLQDDANTEKLATMRERLQTLASIGIKRFAILFDDMETGVADLAAAQLRIVDAATAALPTAKFIVCPSYYSDDIVLDRVFGERPNNYLEDLGKNLDSTIEVFWTGSEVCSRQIGASHLQRIGESLRRKPTLWDNYPVNDGPRMSTQLHLRAFTGRDWRAGAHIAAHMINPALQPILTTIPALTLADVYAQQDTYDYAESFDAAAKKVAGETLALALREDLLAMQDAGLHRLGDKAITLKKKYAAFDHPVAHEICDWLSGVYTVSAEVVQTQ
jgi:hyaluronoglucosaminidase